MLNSVKARPKKSKIEVMMGRQIVIIFFVQILLCIFCAAYYSIWFESNEVIRLLISTNLSERIGLFGYPKSLQRCQSRV